MTTEVPMFSAKGDTTEFEKTLPLVGDTQLLKEASHVLVTNWDGDATRVFVGKTPADMHESWFNPNDKGSLSVFGLNMGGQVIFGMARYRGDSRADNELEREDHFFIKATIQLN
jgi:hypothetical protein